MYKSTEPYPHILSKQHKMKTWGFFYHSVSKTFFHEVVSKFDKHGKRNSLYY